MKNLLKKTKRTLYIEDEVLETAPKGKGTLIFFTLNRFVSDDDLEKEYKQRGLLPATIEALAEYDLKNPKGMDEMKFVGTHWKDAKGKWCYSAFSRWNDERKVYVNRLGCGWVDHWWFAASSPKNLDKVIKEI